jgi:hypothetical protein
VTETRVTENRVTENRVTDNGAGATPAARPAARGRAATAPGDLEIRTPNLLYDDVQDDLRATVRGLLADRCDWTAVLRRTESDEPYDLALWRTLAVEVGVAGLLVPEERGGAGAGARELAVVAEELGRSVAPVPFLGSAVLATAALLALPAGEQVDRLLAGLAAGERIATLAVPLSTAPATPFPTSVRLVGDKLSGRVGTVVDVTVADTVLVPALSADGPVLAVLELPAAGASVEPIVPLDLTRRIGTLSLDGAAATAVARGEFATAALASALTVGAGLLAAEQLGVAQWAMDTTLEYVKTRYQFGRPVGSFQALKHRLADLWTAVTTARAAAMAAADALDHPEDGHDLAVLVAVAASYCSSTAVLATEEAVQLHGGIGMTWEHPAHLYLTRAKSDEIALGTPDRHHAALATLLDLPLA